MPNKTIFTCSSCKATFPRWRGKCTCGVWNSITESLVPTKVYHIPKQSIKKKKEVLENKGVDSDLDIWFNVVRKKLTGYCQCGCGEKSSKNDDKYFKHSCSHLFPKRIFKSIQFHPDNFVERAFWGGCHSVMDDTSIERWVNFDDWEVIKHKFHLLSPLIPQQEKSNKFYTILEKLVHL